MKLPKFTFYGEHKLRRIFLPLSEHSWFSSHKFNSRRVLFCSLIHPVLNWQSERVGITALMLQKTKSHSHCPLKEFPFRESFPVSWYKNYLFPNNITHLQNILCWKIHPDWIYYKKKAYLHYWNLFLNYINYNILFILSISISSWTLHRHRVYAGLFKTNSSTWLERWKLIMLYILDLEVKSFWTNTKKIDCKTLNSLPLLIGKQI